MKKILIFLLFSICIFNSCKKDSSNPVNTNTVPSAPTLLSPTNVSTNVAVAPNLSWNASTGAVSYTLQVSTNSSFSSFVYNQSGITSTSQKVTMLSPLTIYYWRVNATNNYGTSDWSTVRSFTTTLAPPVAPVLSFPVNGVKGQSTVLSFSWNVSSSAASYTLQVSEDSLFTSFVYNTSGLTETNQQIVGLSFSATYYWRVNAINSLGTSGWSSIWNFTTITFCGNGTVSYSGKTYHTVLIGAQCWLKENLDVGTMINGSTEADSMRNNGIIEKYCYNNNPSNCTTYGGLYQWAEAVQYKNGATNTTSPNPAFSGNIQGICPQGWHIPTKEEYQTLSSTVNGNSNPLKAIGQGNPQYDGAGTNTSGFSALFAGFRTVNGYYQELEISPYFWSSMEGTTADAYLMYFDYYGSSIDFPFLKKACGVSVRCMKD